jgi:hypothetical protein
MLRVSFGASLFGRIRKGKPYRHPGHGPHEAPA